MFYRTLHTYILRELLRVFLLTASALTTLMAFGGTFKPLTKQGINIGQLMIILINLMPAMLAYSIPVAALFAAVLVYWRMSTDNELTACRAGGISFVTIVVPALMLGLVVASIDLVFVNYVVPRYLQSTERAVRRDMGSLIVSQVDRQEKIQFDLLPFQGTADSAKVLPGDPADPDLQTVELYGMAVSMIDQGKPTREVIAQKATLRIHNHPDQDFTEIEIGLDNAAAFDPNNAFQKVTGSVPTISPDGQPLQIPSLVKSKAKFLNWRDLLKLWKDPYLFPPVTNVVDQIEVLYAYREISQNIEKWWQAESHHGAVPVRFQQTAMIGNGKSELTLYAPAASVSAAAGAQECLTFSGGVKIEERTNGKLQLTYTCDQADMLISRDSYGGSGFRGALQLRGKVMRQNHVQRIDAMPTGTQVVSGLVLPEAVKAFDPAPGVATTGKAALVTLAQNSQEAGMHELGNRATDGVQKLFLSIGSELHSRGSFSLSCLTLVLFGAALGILLHGKNPLAVFVLGFVPAIVLVLLITAGREVAEGSLKNEPVGIGLIWAGNVVLLLLVAGVYGKLLRQ